MTFTRRLILATLAAAVPSLHAKPAAGAMLARAAPAGIDPRGFLVSEKFDGVRALWDGATLRFRSGLPVSAPPWFTDRLPATPLDGELWMGHGTFEALLGAVRRMQPLDAEWRSVRYQVFDQPGTAGPFADRARRLRGVLQQTAWAPLVAVVQAELPHPKALQHQLDDVLRAGGEGLMLHRASALWRAGRSDDLLKLKPLADAEATVIGHLPGRGRHLGRMGALRLRNDHGVMFQIGTGFSDRQREQPPDLGSRVTYTHRGSTAAGVPRFASFLRERGE